MLNLDNAQDMTTIEKLQFCVKDNITMLSLYNNNAKNISTNDLITHISILFLIMISIQLFKRYYRKYERECDDELISPSDYTLMVKGFPLKFQGGSIKAKLWKFFERSAKKLVKEYPNLCFDLKPPYVKKVNLAYNISVLSKLLTKRK